MELDIRQILTQIVAFLIMIWVLTRYAWKPLLNILDERREKIQAEFDSIATQQDEVKKLKEEYEEKLHDIDTEARRRIQEAVNESRAIAREIHEGAQNEAKALVDRAKMEMASEIDNAKDDLRKEMVGLVVDVTEKILQQKLEGPLHEKLIADFVDQVEFK